MPLVLMVDYDVIREVKDRTKTQKTQAIKGHTAGPKANVPKHQASSHNARGGAKR